MSFKPDKYSNIHIGNLAFTLNVREQHTEVFFFSCSGSKTAHAGVFPVGDSLVLTALADNDLCLCLMTQDGHWNVSHFASQHQRLETRQ